MLLFCRLVELKTIGLGKVWRRALKKPQGQAGCRVAMVTRQPDALLAISSPQGNPSLGSQRRHTHRYSYPIHHVSWHSKDLVTSTVCHRKSKVGGHQDREGKSHGKLLGRYLRLERGNRLKLELVLAVLSECGYDFLSLFFLTQN